MSVASETGALLVVIARSVATLGAGVLAAKNTLKLEETLEKHVDDLEYADLHKEEVAKAAGGTIKVVGFTRFEKGEGIEKRQDDLAAEVAKMVK